MTEIELLQYPDQRLRRHAEKVKKFSNESQEKVNQMVAILYETKGHGLAAPQVGWNERVIIVNPLFNKTKDCVILNPTITNKSSKTDRVLEGCLSVPITSQYVTRPKNVTVSYFNLQGQKRVLPFSGIDAHVWQHEVDHLDGVLFIDHIEDKSVFEKELEELEKE